MALTLSQLRQMVADLCQSETNMRGKQPLDTDVNLQINQAQRIIGRKLFLMGETPLTLTAGTSTYNLRDNATPIVGVRIVRPEIVYINNVPLLDASGMHYGMWSYDELLNSTQNWKTTSQSVPDKAIFLSTGNLILHPTPNSTAAGYTNTVFGQYLPNDLVNNNDVPDMGIPEEIHEAIAYLASRIAISPTISGDEAWKKLQDYDTYWTQIIESTAQQNQATMQTWGSTDDGDINDLMWM